MYIERTLGWNYSCCGRTKKDIDLRPFFALNEVLEKWEMCPWKSVKSPWIFCSKKGYEPCFQLQGSNFLLSCLNPFPKRMLLFSCLQKVINCLKMTNCNRRPRYLLNVFQSSENVFHSRQDSHDGRQQVLNADFISYLFSRPIFF